MGLKGITKITNREFKNAKRIINALCVLGITEEDLLKIKQIRELEKEIQELREFKQTILVTQENKSKAQKEGARSITDEIKEMFAAKVEEYDPNGTRSE